MDKKKIEQIIFQIKKILPQEILDLGNDFEKKIYEIFKKQLRKLNFVSQEKFNTQNEILVAIRKKILRIENRLKKIEKHHKIKKLKTK
ncbi:accessory factor UbiK family protein [Arsenophonus symbiont of Ornithomya chloropus]|uniref:accessory factor UbiK family protein n=1 Tax=Arsenophonus symbiont of Ornithomya chloropus TaxID=634121 RepID=UPI0032B14D6C